MKKICWWIGTDSLILTQYPPGLILWKIKIFFYRIKWFFLHRLFDEHWIVSDRLRKELTDFGIDNRKISVHIDPPKKHIRVEKKWHEGFNVLYYLPHTSIAGMGYIRWVYGADVVRDVVFRFIHNPNIHFIQVSGSSDMELMYPYIDCYIRPSRHDGCPRMVIECRQNNIPYYYSESGNPNVDDIVKLINDEYAKSGKMVN